MSLFDPNIPAPCVLLFGEVLLDVFAEKQVLGGAPFNVAHHLQAFGVHAVLLSCVGEDQRAEQVLQHMAQHHMDTQGIQHHASYPTGVVQVIQDETTHHFDILPNQAYDYIDAEQAIQVANRLKPALLYFGTLAQRHAQSSAALSALLSQVSAPKYLDINLRAPWHTPEILQQSLAQADVLKLNADELKIIVNMLGISKNSLARAAQVIIETYHLEKMIVTCGGYGTLQFMPKDSLRALSTNTADVVDTVGAGDAFAAVSIIGRLLNWSDDLTLTRANQFAAAICQITGAIPDSADFYVPFLSEWQQQ